ncbi:MAG: 50S ribosomal protein L11 methyltransferase [Candidatus Melainabacteria bacterium]|nr:50S ribosomal protein L11 methyltransferase [Candidatus Melainabacteria bacterium]
MTETTKSWAALEIEVKQVDEDLACWVLMQSGAAGCEVEGLPGQPEAGGKVRVRATYDVPVLSEEQFAQISAAFEEYGLAETLKSLRRKDVPEEDWLARWKEGFEPFRVGTRFVVAPSWYHPQADGDCAGKLDEELKSNRHVIYIEPGMAFGTGLHATTQFCLRALESFPPRERILDVGTGSGILAIAAALMNKDSRICAVDIDQVAVDFAAKDFELNEVDGRIELLTGSTDVVKDRVFDMLLSNLTCEDIVALLPDYYKMLSNGGVVLCAGILAEKLPLLEKAAGEKGFRIVQSETIGHWVGIVLQKG